MFQPVVRNRFDSILLDLEPVLWIRISRTLMFLDLLDPDPSLFVGIRMLRSSRKNCKKNSKCKKQIKLKKIFFVGILKAIDEKSRIRIRIRIRTKMPQIHHSTVRNHIRIAKTDMVKAAVKLSIFFLLILITNFSKKFFYLGKYVE